MARELHRVNLNLPKELIARIDEYANKMGLTRSSAICQLAGIALETNDAIQVTKKFMNLLEGMGGEDALKKLQSMQNEKDL